MKNWPQRKVRVRHWLRSWWGIAVKDTLAPLIDTNARLQFFALVALLYIVLPTRGFESWNAQVINSWDSFQAILYALPVSFAMNGFFAIFKTTKQNGELGKWVGHRFIYHSPLHLATIVVTDADNGKLIPFKINGLEKGASIEVRLEKDLHDVQTLKVQFVVFKDQPISWDDYDRPTLLGWLPDNETLYITSLKPTPSNASTIKIYLLSWYGNIS